MQALQQELDRQDYRMKSLRAYAYGLSINATGTEDQLREHLVPSFRFQFPVLDFVVDFIHLEALVAVEIGGLYHRGRLIKDNKKDRALFEQLGICTLRIEEQEIRENLPEVLERIANFILYPQPPLLLDRTVEIKERRKQRAQELKEVGEIVSEFESRMLRQPRARVVEFFSALEETMGDSMIEREALEKIRRSVWSWPELGYSAPGLQVTTVSKLVTYLSEK